MLAVETNTSIFRLEANISGGKKVTLNPKGFLGVALAIYHLCLLVLRLDGV